MVFNRRKIMKVPLLDLKIQYAPLRDETLKSLNDILDSQYFIGGKYVSKLEEDIAAYSGVKHAIGVSSGTDALVASLMGCGIYRPRSTWARRTKWFFPHTRFSRRPAAYGVAERVPFSPTSIPTPTIFRPIP